MIQTGATRGSYASDRASEVRCIQGFLRIIARAASIVSVVALGGFVSITACALTG